MNKVLFWRPRKKNILSLKNIQNSLTFNVQLKVEADVWRLLLVACWCYLLYFSDPRYALTGIQWITICKRTKGQVLVGMLQFVHETCNLVSNILSLTLYVIPGFVGNKEFLSVAVSLSFFLCINIPVFSINSVWVVKLEIPDLELMNENP